MSDYSETIKDIKMQLRIESFSKKSNQTRRRKVDETPYI